MRRYTVAYAPSTPSGRRSAAPMPGKALKCFLESHAGTARANASAIGSGRSGWWGITALAKRLWLQRDTRSLVEAHGVEPDQLRIPALCCIRLWVAAVTAGLSRVSTSTKAMNGEGPLRTWLTAVELSSPPHAARRSASVAARRPRAHCRVHSLVDGRCVLPMMGKKE